MKNDVFLDVTRVALVRTDVSEKSNQADKSEREEQC
jgi:hypothetical protein